MFFVVCTRFDGRFRPLTDFFYMSPNRRSISTDFFSTLDPCRPSISTVFFSECNPVDRRYRPYSSVIVILSTVDFDRILLRV